MAKAMSGIDYLFQRMRDRWLRETASEIRTAPPLFVLSASHNLGQVPIELILSARLARRTAPETCVEMAAGVVDRREPYTAAKCAVEFPLEFPRASLPSGSRRRL